MKRGIIKEPVSSLVSRYKNEEPLPRCEFPNTHTPCHFHCLSNFHTGFDYTPVHIYDSTVTLALGLVTLTPRDLALARMSTRFREETACPILKRKG